MDHLADEVEREKMRAIGIRNLLHSVTKEHDAEKQQLEVSRLFYLPIHTKYKRMEMIINRMSRLSRHY